MNELGEIRPADDAPRARKLEGVKVRISASPPRLPTTVFVVMVEQLYAHDVRLCGVFSTSEKAEKFKEEMRLGDDIVIYEVEVDDEDFVA